MITDKAKWQRDSEGLWITFRVSEGSESEVKKACEFADPREIVLKRRTRSLTQNAYMWVLINKIAEKTRTSPKAVYRQAIRDLGGNSEIIPVRSDAASHFHEVWEQNGTGWICEVFGQSKIKGYINLIIYYGSSTYDSAQFTELVNRIIDDAKELGIETMTPQQLSLLERE